MDLPKLTKKQEKFLLRYVTNGNNATDAYRFAYNCKNSKPETVTTEAGRMLAHPKLIPWIEQAEKNVREVFQDEIKYTAKDCFDELDDVRERAKQGHNRYSDELKAIELKGKLAGHFVDKHQVTGGGLADVLDQLK